MQSPGQWFPTDSALVMLRRKALILPGVDAAKFVGDWKPPSKPKKSSNFSAPLGATSSEAAHWVVTEVGENLPNLPSVGDGSRTDPEQLKREMNAAYGDYKTWKEWDD